MWGGQEKEWVGCFLDDLKAFGINAGKPPNTVSARIAAVKLPGCSPSGSVGNLETF